MQLYNEIEIFTEIAPTLVLLRRIQDGGPGSSFSMSIRMGEKNQRPERPKWQRVIGKPD